MKKHEYFDLWVHENEELEPILGHRILGRKTLHEWPLSCVEQLDLSNGERRIYKIQSGASVEPEFYRKARSPLLALSETIWESNGHSVMLMELIDAPMVQDLNLTEGKAVKTGKEVMMLIRRLRVSLPATST